MSDASARRGLVAVLAVAAILVVLIVHFVTSVPPCAGLGGSC